MSVAGTAEQSLERIAIALERIADALHAPIGIDNETVSVTEALRDLANDVNEIRYGDPLKVAVEP